MNIRTTLFTAIGVSSLSLVAQPQLDVALYDNGNNTLDVRVRPDQNFDGLFSSLVFTIQWEVASGANLGNESQVSPAADYLPISKSGVETDDGVYRYQPFVGFGFSSLMNEGTSWTAGMEYTICTIPVQNGSSLFQIVNDTWTGNNNADFFVSLNGADHTGIIYGNPSLLVEGASSNGTAVLLQPNPATKETQLTLSAAQATDVQVELCDPAGRTVWEQRYDGLNGTRRQTIDLGGFGAGTYLMRVRSIEGVQVHRLVIQ